MKVKLYDTFKGEQIEKESIGILRYEDSTFGVLQLTKENQFIIQDEMIPDDMNPVKQKEQDKQRENELKELKEFMNPK